MLQMKSVKTQGERLILTHEANYKKNGLQFRNTVDRISE